MAIRGELSKLRRAVSAMTTPDDPVANRREFFQWVGRETNELLFGNTLLPELSLPWVVPPELFPAFLDALGIDVHRLPDSPDGTPGGIELRPRTGSSYQLFAIREAQRLGIADRPEAACLWPTLEQLSEPPAVDWQEREDRRERDGETVLPGIIFVLRALATEQGVPTD